MDSDVVVTMLRNRTFSERLGPDEPERGCRGLVVSTVERLRDRFRRVARSRIATARFGPDAVSRWPILGQPQRLEDVLVGACRVAEGPSADAVRLHLEPAPEDGMPGDLLEALEYGHPLGVPPLAIWRSALRQSERQVFPALVAELHRKHDERLRDGGPLRCQALS